MQIDLSAFRIEKNRASVRELFDFGSVIFYFLGLNRFSELTENNLLFVPLANTFAQCVVECKAGELNNLKSE